MAQTLPLCLRPRPSPRCLARRVFTKTESTGCLPLWVRRAEQFNRVADIKGRVGREARRKPDFLSPRRTGREDFPHPALAEAVSRRHAQAGARRSGTEKLQAEALKVRVIRDTFRRTEGPLAASP